MNNKTMKVNKPSWSLVSNKKLLCKVGEYFLSYSSGKLYIQRTLESDHELLLGLPSSYIGNLLSKPRYIERFLRLEPRLAIPINSKSCLLSYQGRILNIDLMSKTLIVEHQYRSNMNNTLSFLPIDGKVYYGEYFPNKENEPVSIFVRNEDGVWGKCFEFGRKTVKHIHAISYDDYRSCFWVLTGDQDSESGIWKVSKDFKSVEPLFMGKQKFRSCFLYPTEKGLLYATDTPTEENAVYFIEYSKDLNTFKEPIKKFSLPGPVIHGRILSDNRFVLSTSVEPDSSLPKWQYRICNRLAPGIHSKHSHVIYYDNGLFYDILSLKKDFLNMWLFQFGAIQFPFILNENTIICTLQALEKFDSKSIVIKL